MRMSEIFMKIGTLSLSCASLVAQLKIRNTQISQQAASSNLLSLRLKNKPRHQSQTNGG